MSDRSNNNSSLGMGTLTEVHAHCSMLSRGCGAAGFQTAVIVRLLVFSWWTGDGNRGQENKGKCHSY